MPSLASLGRRSLRPLPWVLSFVFLSSTYLHAATPRDQLLRYVPDDVGFCLVLNDLRGHGAALADSPFVEELSRSALGKTLRASAELMQILKQEDNLKKQFGLDWTKLREEILGDALVFAYRPGPPGKPELEQGLILLRARDAKLLAAVIGKTNEKAKVEAIEHQTLMYQKRTEGKEVVYYHLNGPVLLISGQEGMLREALSLDRSRDANAEPGVARQMRTLGVEKAFLAVWINPRSWDADLKDKIDKAAPKEATALKQFDAYWKAIDGAALAAALDKDLTLSLVLRAKSADLPAAGRRYVSEAAKPGEFWRSVPDDALLAIAGRIDAAALLESIGEFLTIEDRRLLLTTLNRTVGSVLDKDFVKEVLPFLGPDWGFCITASAADDKNWFPAAILAVKVAPGDSTAPVDQALYSLLNSLSFNAVLAYNALSPNQRMTLKTLARDKREIKYLDSEGLPPSLRPAFGLANGYLLLASSPAVLDRYSKPGTGALPDATGSMPLLRISFKEIRQFLKTRGDAVTEYLVTQNGADRADTRQMLEQFVSSLQLLDRIEVRQRVGEGQVTFSLVIQTTQPLRK